MSEEARDFRSLRHVALFSALNSDVLSRLDRLTRWRRFSKGSEVISFNETSKEVYFLTMGKASVRIHTANNKDIVFRTIRPGDVFGELSAIDEKPRSASIDVLEPSLIGAMSSLHFGNALLDESELARALIRHLAAEVRKQTERVLEFSTLAVSNRIQAELLRISRRYPASDGQVSIDKSPSHATIAGRISTHREAVTKEFSRLTKLGIIRRHDSALVVLDLERLSAMVDEAASV